MLLEVLKGVADSIIATYEENKPEIMIYGGAAGISIAGVLAAVAAYKSKGDVDALKQEFKDIEETEAEVVDYTKEKARKDKLSAFFFYGKRIALRFVLPITIFIASWLCVHGGVYEFEQINARLMEEVARLTATVAACEDQLAKKIGPEEVLKAKYEKQDAQNEEQVEVKDYGTASDGRFFIKLDLQTCPDAFWNKDFDDRISFLKMVQLDLENFAHRQVEKYGGCIIESWEVMNAIGCYCYGKDVDWREAHKDIRYIFRKGDAISINFGLDDAQMLRDYERSPKDEVWVYINFNRGVKVPRSPRVVKG